MANKQPNDKDLSPAAGSQDEEVSPRGESSEGGSPERDGSGDAPFPIVAIGASAGGLAALRQLLEQVPADSGLAFVVIMHLSPEHESHLQGLLQPHVAIPVRQVTEATTPIERNRVYVIPPNANLDSIDTHLRLTELEKARQQRAPIDHFFRTIAQSHDQNAIGVVLSGTGSDGTLGLRRIKERGGLTVVQDPAEAEYDGMPRSALAGAPVDLVLPLADIPSAILRFARTEPQLPLPEEGGLGDADTRQLLQKIFAQVRVRTGRDFSQYKDSTVLRRLSRRMQFNHIREPLEYLELLREQPEEVEAFAHDLLITVTSFFRDPEVFENLEKEIIPSLFRGKGASDGVRAWSVGCATGEEAYSLAMLLVEEAERQGEPVPVHVFATDLHEASLTKAREGHYPAEIAADVSAERLDRFFQQDGSGYRVRKQLREVVLFAQHDILSDPPFSRLDLISCRNLLIYLRRDLHQQVAELFHYSLNADGVVVLGTSESIDAKDLFFFEDKKHCVYRKRNVPTREPRLPVFPVVPAQGASAIPQTTTASTSMPYEALHQRIVQQHSPPSALVSPDDNVVHLAADAGRYFVQPEGPVTANVFKLARQELRGELQTAIATSRRERRAVRTRSVPVPFNGTPSAVAVDVQPALDPQQDGFLVVTFDEHPWSEQQDIDPGTQPDTAEGAGGPDRMQAAEAERRLAEQRLQQLVDEKETSQEELKASNEELHSANEELRSTLEELETSKEELQSINEELQTVNQENRHKVEELDQLSSDLQNLLVATDIATLFLSRDLRILRFTPRIKNLFNIREVDRGRPLSDVTNWLGYDSLGDDARQVIERLIPIERNLQAPDGKWFLSRVLPYRDARDRIDGVVATFVDITAQKEAEEAVRESKNYAEKIIDTLPEPLLVLTPELIVQSANESFFDQFGVSKEETIGYKIYDLGNGQWNLPELKEALEEILPRKKTFDGFEIDHVFEGIGRRVMMVNGRQLDHVQLILLGMADITERKRMEQELRESHRHKDAFLAMLGHELRNPLGAIRNATELLRHSATEEPSVSRVSGVLERQSVHMTRIIDGLLDLSRIARGKIHLDLETVDVREVLGSVLDDRASHVSRAGLELRKDIASEPLWVHGDATRLAQVFDNLLGNAMKFTDGPGTIEVELREDGDAARLRVRDTGQGIRPALLSKIFEAFEQEGQDVARSAGGIGMGLALARGLVELHHGTIDAQSEGTGRGAEFVVRLPLTLAPRDAASAPEEPVPYQARRVLLVEDNADAAQMFHEMLEGAGHEVTVARTGQQGLDVLHDGGADVVLCDLGLPGMSGYELVRRIRSDDDLADVRVIALTGYGQAEDRKRTAEAGFDEHLVKPVDLNTLNSVLARTGGGAA